MTEEELTVVKAMATYGGSFVKALAQCFYHADSHNLLKLRLTFHEYWHQYTDFPNNQGEVVIKELSPEELKDLVAEEKSLQDIRQSL